MPKASSPKPIDVPPKNTTKVDAEYVGQVTAASSNALADATVRVATEYLEKVLKPNKLPNDDVLPHLQSVVSTYLANATTLVDGLIDGVRTGLESAPSGGS